MYQTEELFRKKIVVYNFISIVLVMFIHSHNTDVYNLDSGYAFYIENFVRLMCGFAVPMFFIMSGYLFFRNFAPELDDMRNSARGKQIKYWTNSFVIKYKSRIKSVLIPYVLWCTIYYLFFSLVLKLPIVSGIVNSEPVQFGFINWIKWLWIDEYYVFWFLKDLIVLVAISPVIYIVLKNRFGFTGWIVLGIVVGLQIVNVQIPHINIFYLWGAFIGINYKNAPLYSGSKIRFIARLSVTILLIYVLVLTILKITNMSSGDELVGCIVLWYAFSDTTIDKSWMTMTFFIYCVHDIILETVEKGWLLLAGVGEWQALIDYFCMPLITIGIIYLIAKFMNRYIPKVYMILTGGR